MTNTTNGALLRRAALPLLAVVGGCITHTVESAPIEIKPIHITMDINLRVQRELDDFFAFEKTAPAPTATEPGKE